MQIVQTDWGRREWGAPSLRNFHFSPFWLRNWTTLKLLYTPSDSSYESIGNHACNGQPPFAPLRHDTTWSHEAVAPHDLAPRVPSRSTVAIHWRDWCHDVQILHSCATLLKLFIGVDPAVMECESGNWRSRWSVAYHRLRAYAGGALPCLGMFYFCSLVRICNYCKCFLTFAEWTGFRPVAWMVSTGIHSSILKTL